MRVKASGWQLSLWVEGSRCTQAPAMLLAACLQPPTRKDVRVCGALGEHVWLRAYAVSEESTRFVAGGMLTCPEQTKAHAETDEDGRAGIVTWAVLILQVLAAVVSRAAGVTR